MTNPNQKNRPIGIQDLRGSIFSSLLGFSMTRMSNLYLTTMVWLLFLPIFESRHLFKKEPKSPGALKLQITQRGLAYAKTVGMEFLLSQLRKEPIQDQNGSYSVPPLGDLSLSFTNIQIRQLRVNDSEASFEEGRGVRLSIRNAQIVFSSNWRMKHLFGQDDGSVQANFSGLSVSVLLGLDVDYAGWLQLQCLSCSANILDFQMRFSGPNSYLYDWISQGLKSSLISELNQEVCAEVKKSIDNFSHCLRHTEFWAEISPIAGFDYSLVSKPEIANDRCTLDLKGEFFSVERRQRSPLKPTPIPLSNQSDSMVVIGISDFLVNSAAFVYFSGNTLQVKYTEETVSRRFPFHLNSEDIGSFIPELKRQFPEMPMEFHLAARQAPKLHFHPGGLDAAILGQARAFVVPPDSSPLHVFTLNFDCNFTGQIILEGVRSGNSFAKVRGSLALKGLRLSQEWSRIGKIEVSSLESLLKIVGHVALAGYNRKLRGGMLLPDLFGASLMDPVVSMHEGYVLIQTDLRVHLPNSAP